MCKNVYDGSGGNIRRLQVPSARVIISVPEAACQDNLWWHYSTRHLSRHTTTQPDPTTISLSPCLANSTAAAGGLIRQAFVV